MKANLENVIELDIKPLYRFLPEEKGTIITNPPYGERLGDQIDELYAEMGTHFKKNLAGFTVWLITSNFEALKSLGLKPSKKYTLFNGALECKYLRYDLFEGKRSEHLKKS